MTSSSQKSRISSGKGQTQVTMLQHPSRVALLMAFAAALLGWGLSRTEATFADGLRYIHQAEQIEAGSWTSSLINGIDHPLHPLGICCGAPLARWRGPGLVATSRPGPLLYVRGSAGHPDLPADTRALRREGCLAGLRAGDRQPHRRLHRRERPFREYVSALLVLRPLGRRSASCVKVGCPGWRRRFGFGALAYMTRPEGMLLPAALTATLLIQPLLEARNLNWSRWRRVVACSLGGIVLLAGPYMTLRGGVATKPAIARVLGLAPRSQALAPRAREAAAPGAERRRDLPARDGPHAQGVSRGGHPDLVPVFASGARPGGWVAGRARAGLFLSIVLAASAVGALAAPRDRRLLHGPPRTGSRRHLDSGRGAMGSPG